MKLKDKRVIVIGAAGGLGAKIAHAFADKGSAVTIVDRSIEALAPLLAELKEKGVEAASVVGDITKEEDITRIIPESEGLIGPTDVLANVAGLMPFKLAKDTSPAEVHSALMVNVYGTIRLTQVVLPGMLERGSGRIVNIGSTFGSLAFPYFSVYSATKSAVRGFSEALRRELLGTGVGVSYIAPRAIRSTQPPIFFEMAKKMKMNLDKPEKVAKIVVEAVEKEQNEVYIGGPEKFFAFINKLKPSMVDGSLKKQTSVMKEYCRKFPK